MDADRLTELDTFFRVVKSTFISALSDTESLSTDADTAAVEGCHSDLKALAFFAEQVCFRNFDVIENQFCRRRRADAQFIIVFAEAKAFPAFFLR